MRPSSINSWTPLRRLEDLPSNSRKFVNTVGGVAAACALGARPRYAIALAAPTSMPRRESSRVIRWSAERSVGWQQRQLAAPPSCVAQVNIDDLPAEEGASHFHGANAAWKRRMARPHWLRERRSLLGPFSVPQGVWRTKSALTHSTSILRGRRERCQGQPPASRTCTSSGEVEVGPLLGHSASLPLRCHCDRRSGALDGAK